MFNEACVLGFQNSTELKYDPVSSFTNSHAIQNSFNRVKVLNVF